jgi:alpha-mannosidase
VVEQPDGSVVFVEASPYGMGQVVNAPNRVHVIENRGGIVLENAHLRVELTKGGTLTSLIEKSSGREVLSAPGNRLEIYDDHPTAYDAWDVDPFHLETRRDCPAAESFKILPGTALRAEVAFERKIGDNSRMRQVVRLEADARRVEFHTEMDWNESHKMLKVAFPVNVRAMNATYEMQFGCVERPTHYTTSYDLAKYEVPGHKWVDLSEHGFGVALLTESKYGFSTYGDTMRISLLRSPKSPDPNADMGYHSFAYAIMPHLGGWREAGVVAESFRFNVPVLWAPGVTQTRSFAAVNDPNLVLDTIKKAEDSDAIIVRLYECHGARGIARLTFDLPFKSAVFCNILEEDGEAATVRGSTIEVPYTPFKIVTLKLR